jgi:pimeloyl-ACP methyl ester carboxylesterase
MRLVLLHALPLDGRQWSGQMGILPGRTIAPTLYSFGNSLADWAAGALDAAGDGPLIVVGNSVGGSCALEMARQAPDRIESLILIGTKPGHRAEPDFRERFIAALENDRPATLRTWVDQLLSPTAEEGIRRHVHALAEAQSLADLITGVRVFHGRPDSEDVASSWTKSLVVVHGEHDRTRVAFCGLGQTSPAETAAESRRRNRRRETVADCGHYVNLERPDAFDAILAGIVKSCIAGEGLRAP